MTEVSTLLSIRQVQEHARLFAMLLALTTGVLLISDLWEQTLTQDAMASAGRGVIFILLALGLMGTRRLSLIITGLLCCTALPPLVSGDSPGQPSEWLALLTLLLCVGLSLAPAAQRVDGEPR